MPIHTEPIITVQCRIGNLDISFENTCNQHLIKCIGSMYTPMLYQFTPQIPPATPSFRAAIVFLSVVVLLLITCVALLVLALTVTATKLNKLRGEKGHTDPPHYYDKTGRGEGKTKEGIYDEVGEGTGPIEGQREHYQ